MLTGESGLESQVERESETQRFPGGAVYLRGPRIVHTLRPFAKLPHSVN